MPIRTSMLYCLAQSMTCLISSNEFHGERQNIREIGTMSLHASITLYQQKGLKEFLNSFKFSYLDIIQNDEIFRGYIRGFFFKFFISIQHL